MKWLKRIGLVVLVVVAVLVAVGLVLPTTYTVSRSVVIEAPREVIHALVSDLKQWPKWEPWTHAEPSIVVAIGDVTSGVGASQSWTDPQGGGELTFTAVDPEAGVTYDMMFADKYPGEGRISYAASADAVEVTWTMNGDTKTPIIGGYFAKLMPGMIGPMFADGMQRLKNAAEAEAAGSAEDVEPTEAETG